MLFDSAEKKNIESPLVKACPGDGGGGSGIHNGGKDGTACGGGGGFSYTTGESSNSTTDCRIGRRDKSAQTGCEKGAVM